jgi:FkbM family methyltransferase
MIESAEEKGEIREIHLRGFDYPVFIPTSVGLGELIRVIVEQTNPGHHHYYEFEGARIGPTDVVLDCGASEGFFCLSVHSRCSKVYAIEPLPEFVACLRLNLKHIQNAEILPFGLSDKTGSAVLVTRGICSYISEKEEGLAITQSTIDNLFYDKGKRVDFIKADLEGYEIRMLEGARQTIAKHKPKISITTYHDPSHARQIRDILLEIEPRYRIATKGTTQYGTPVMLHAWV